MPICPVPPVKVFDLLYLNGMSLHKKSLKFRKRNLRACIKEIPGRMEFVTEFEGKTAKDIRNKMDEIMATRGEGLILKHLGSEYILNGRNKDWIKVKPEYMVRPRYHFWIIRYQRVSRTTWVKPLMYLLLVCPIYRGLPCQPLNTSCRRKLWYWEAVRWRFHPLVRRPR